MEQSENLEQTECIEDLSVQKETVEKPENAVNDEHEDISSDEEVQNLSVEKNENDQMEMETETIEKVVEPQQQQQPQQQEEQNNPDETNKEKETTENEMEQDEKGVDLSSFLRVEMNDESGTNGPNEQQNQQQPPKVKAEVDKTEEIKPAAVSTAAPEPVASSDENIKTEIKSEEIPATASSENAEKDNDSETSDDDEVFLPVLRSFTTIKTA